MSENSDDTRNRQEQGGDPARAQEDSTPGQQGGQPQERRGQPPGQGGQPQERGGQPQERGGQPAGQQTQGSQPADQQVPSEQPPAGQQARGGQPPGGQAYGQPAATGPNILQEWVIYIAALFGLAGGGFGLAWVIIDAIDQPVFELQDAGFGSGSIGLAGPSLQVVLVAIVAAVVAGVWLGRTLNEDDQTTFKIAGAAVAAGTAVFMLLSLIFVSVTLEDISIAFGGLLINTIITALFAAGLAAGGVWLSRNQYPSMS